MKSFLKLMKCARCGKEYEPNSGAIVCTNHDDGRLDIFYDYEELRSILTKEVLSRRPNGVWKYKELLPVNDEEHH